MRVLLGIVLLAAVALPASAFAADRTPPKMAKAEMRDADHDGKADGVLVTFSERIRHVNDTKKPFPFAVAGYTVKGVGAASGKTVLIKLAEKPASDYAARPKVTYNRTTSKPVLDRAGNQAKAQRFGGTLAHGRDRDGDGYPSPADCAPDNGAIHPGAADAPDVGFLDANCDGIDGDRALSVFVAPTGSDANSGLTSALAKQTIQSAITAAVGASRTAVLVQSGTYPETVTTSGNIGLYGSYDTNWARSAALRDSTVVSGAPALVIDGATGIRMQLITFSGQQPVSGLTVYGIRATASTVTLEAVHVIAANGKPGTAGGSGSVGAVGGPGGDAMGGTAGAGGTSPLGCLRRHRRFRHLRSGRGQLRW